jgi:hypothetical protein
VVLCLQAAGSSLEKTENSGCAIFDELGGVGMLIFLGRCFQVQSGEAESFSRKHGFHLADRISKREGK